MRCNTVAIRLDMCSLALHTRGLGSSSCSRWVRTRGRGGRRRVTACITSDGSTGRSRTSQAPPRPARRASHGSSWSAASRAPPTRSSPRGRWRQEAGCAATSTRSRRPCTCCGASSPSRSAGSRTSWSPATSACSRSGRGMPSPTRARTRSAGCRSTRPCGSHPTPAARTRSSRRDRSTRPSSSRARSGRGSGIRPFASSGTTRGPRPRRRRCGSTTRRVDANPPGWTRPCWPTAASP